MPARRFLLPLAAAALLAGCGDRHLVLRVDVLSFIVPADRQRDFGPVPAVPGGVATGEVALVDNADVSLLQESIHDSLSRLLWKRTRRRPMVIPLITEL